MMVENCRLRRERFDEFCQKPTIVYHVTPIDNQVEYDTCADTYVFGSNFVVPNYA
jgi:hypothetical protein